MAITSKWRQHIEAWQRSGLSQAAYCAEQKINVRTFTARLSDYRKSPQSDSATLIPVQVSRRSLKRLRLSITTAIVWNYRHQYQHSG